MTKRPLRRPALRLDLTAMVDIALLLLLSFMVIDTFDRPKTMDLVLPSGGESHCGCNFVCGNGLIMNVVLSAQNKIYYWSGGFLQSIESLHTTDYTPQGFRQILLQRQAEIHRAQPTHDLIVLVQPLPAATAENVVDILDELAITDTKTYTLVDAAAFSSPALRQKVYAVAMH
jgi:biopolymer transport protein ExbD